MTRAVGLALGSSEAQAAQIRAGLDMHRNIAAALRSVAGSHFPFQGAAQLDRQWIASLG